MTTKILKVGLIGFGLSGKTFHYPLVTTHVGFKLSMVYSSKRETAEELQESNPDCIITQDIDDVFNSEVDIVVITSPNKLHYEHAVRALEAGKHIVVEKPFTLDSEQAIQLLELSEKKNLICSVFHNRRWDGDFKTVEKIIHNQSLGNLREYEAHFDRFRNYQKPGAWKEKKAEPGAGILYDLGPHLIDQALYLFGMPQSIYADIRTQRIGLEVDDNFELLLYYPNLKVTLKAGMLVKEVLPKFILLGDQGSFVKYGMDIQESQSKSGLLPNDKIWGIEDPSY
ncbi:MAG: Gfo/Idh/MocA family oxidoreductase, partial [Bacteroidota bacterium]